MFQMAVPLPKLKPPYWRWTWLVYTRTTEPGAMTQAGKTNLGLPSSTSIRAQPAKSWGAVAPLVISTYSSDSDLATRPS